jgi:multidrug efflux pump
MRMLPVTLIFVLSASLIVALVYLPIMGGVSGRFSRMIGNAGAALRAAAPLWVRLVLVPLALMGLFVGAMMMLNPSYLFETDATGIGAMLPGALVFAVFGSFASIVMDSVAFRRQAKKIEGGYRRSIFGHFIAFIAGNPVMPIVTIGAVFGVVIGVFNYFGQNNNGVEFFVDSEPEQAIVYVRARGNLSLEEKDALVKRAEAMGLAHPGVDTAFAFAGEGGLDNNTGGAEAPKDTIGQVQFETIPWEDRADYAATHDDVTLDELDGDVIIDDLAAQMAQIPGIEIEILAQDRGPASAKPVHLRLKGDNWAQLLETTGELRALVDATPGLTQIEDTRPLPGIDWQIDVDVEKAGRYGADVATVGAMVQLVTRGILLDSYTPEGSDEEIEIRVRLPEDDRVLSTLDTLKLRTQDGLVPLSNFITRTPVAKLAEINRVDQKRHFDIKAAVESDLQVFSTDVDGTSTIVGYGTIVPAEEASIAIGDKRFTVTSFANEFDEADVAQLNADGALKAVPLTGNERIEVLTQWLDANPLPSGLEWEWTGDQEDQAESQTFLVSAFSAALGLMFIILLAQFNSFYNATLVLIAVILSTTGVLIGMLVMGQYFSVIMTGVGIVALAGIVVNNNIVLIDTYQEYARVMPKIEAIIRTAEDRIRPVLLTTITTMAGLTPMMFGLSLDFINGGYSVNSPTALWWINLATAVVFGLGIATVLTLVFTPSMLALRVWFWTYFMAGTHLMARMSLGEASRSAQDWALARQAKKVKGPTILWEEDETPPQTPNLRAAE